MPYVYEGEEPTRVNDVRYTPGSTTESDDVKGKPGFRKVSDDEVQKLAADRPGNFANAQTDRWQERFSEVNAWLGDASVAAPLNVVVGDNEAPYGPPTGTVTTKQAVMRDATNSAERRAFGDHEWVGEDEENLGDGTSAQVSKAQARDSGRVEEVTDEYILSKQETQDEDEGKSKSGSSSTSSGN